MTIQVRINGFGRMVSRTTGLVRLVGSADR